MRTTNSLPGAPHAAEVSGAGLPSLDLDDGRGVRVAHSSFHGHQRFSWDLFRGFESCRVLTYSIDLRTVRRLFADLGVAKIECVIGTLATIDRIEKILAAQQAAISSAAVIVTELSNAGCDVVAELASGRLAFRVLKDQVSHTKLYLLAGGTKPATRVIIGSANFSEQAFSGRQHETLAMYDDDSAAWAFYESMYRDVRDMASQEIDPALLTARNRPVDIQDAPLLADDSPSVLIVGDGSAGETDEERASIIRKAKEIRNRIGPVLPAARGHRLTLEADRKASIRRALRQRPPADAEPASFTILADTRTATFAGKEFALDYDPALAVADGAAMTEYFAGFEQFSGTPQELFELQQEYFAFWSWLYFAPFMCDLRNRAALANRDVVRFERVAVLYGKSNCGKTSLIRALLRSMFPDEPLAACMDKNLFKAATLDAITRRAKRCPMFFDDITAKQMASTGKDFIKDENQPGLAEYPALVISMNRHEDSFPDEIMKRAFLIYTKTALAVFKHQARQDQDERIRRVTDRLTGHLYRRYLHLVLDELDRDPLPDDWLELSSRVLSELLAPAADSDPPQWAAPQTLNLHAERRYKSLRNKLGYLLRPEAMIDSSSKQPEGWWIHPDADRVVVRERVNQYGRGAFKWEQVPSTIIDADAPSSGHTTLVLSELQEFLTSWTHPSTSPPTPNIDQTQPAEPKRRRWGFRRYRPPR